MVIGFRDLSFQNLLRERVWMKDTSSFRSNENPHERQEKRAKTLFQWEYETCGESVEQNPEVEIRTFKETANGGTAVQNSNVKTGAFDVCRTEECALEKSAEVMKQIHPIGFQ